MGGWMDGGDGSHGWTPGITWPLELLPWWKAELNIVSLCQHLHLNPSKEKPEIWQAFLTHWYFTRPGLLVSLCYFFFFFFCILTPWEDTALLGGNVWVIKGLRFLLEDKIFHLHGTQPHLSLYNKVFPRNLVKDRREMEHALHLSRRWRYWVSAQIEIQFWVLSWILSSVLQIGHCGRRLYITRFLFFFFRFFLRRHLDIFSRVSANFKVGKTHHSRKNVDRVDF